jgi:hypothetical protein
MSTPSTSYNKVLDQVLELDLDSQLQLLEELATLVHRRVTRETKHSILELQIWAKKSGRVLMLRSM